METMAAREKIDRCTLFNHTVTPSSKGLGERSTVLYVFCIPKVYTYEVILRSSWMTPSSQHDTTLYKIQGLLFGTFRPGYGIRLYEDERGSI